MKIIGEKINGTRKSIQEAIIQRNVDLIRALAVQQSEAGAAWLDVNAGTHPDREPEDLAWLIDTIQAEVAIPLCLDSSSPETLAAGLAKTRLTPMINSINGDDKKLESILPLVAKHHCPVIALAMDEKEIPATSESRVAVVDKIITESRKAGVPDENLYIDPLVMTISTNAQSGIIFLESIRQIKKKYPEVHFTAGLSNISFGLPARSFINRSLLTLAIEAGLDSAICNPLDSELIATIHSTELVLGRDDYCLNYIKWYRSRSLK
ncbi:MAG: methyltetrahydrofolate cobalamin methyltransferase [Spirochaetales bacterium]|nr:methyltetrahydrofolate cobalamin methyltransferase [Spirochaetales bacterium]